MRTNIVLVSAALVFFLLIGDFRQPSTDVLGGFLLDGHSFLSGHGSSLVSWLSADKSTVVEAAEDDSKASGSDEKNDADDAKEKADGLKELWDSVMLG